MVSGLTLQGLDRLQTSTLSVCCFGNLVLATTPRVEEAGWKHRRQHPEVVFPNPKTKQECLKKFLMQRSERVRGEEVGSSLL